MEEEEEGGKGCGPWPAVDSWTVVGSYCPHCPHCCHHLSLERQDHLGEGGSTYTRDITGYLGQSPSYCRGGHLCQRSTRGTISTNFVRTLQQHLTNNRTAPLVIQSLPNQYKATFPFSSSFQLQQLCSRQWGKNPCWAILVIPVMQGPEFPGENFLICGNTVTVQLSGGYTVTIVTSGNTVTVTAIWWQYRVMPQAEVKSER